uniref:Uncharacterized protein n=1 Tax=Onchocerca volvulus TaxID=6282 RepID=A0A8R1TU74_ONCVO
MDDNELAKMKNQREKHVRELVGNFVMDQEILDDIDNRIGMIKEDVKEIEIQGDLIGLTLCTTFQLRIINHDDNGKPTFIPKQTPSLDWTDVSLIKNAYLAKCFDKDNLL